MGYTYSKSANQIIEEYENYFSITGNIIYGYNLTEYINSLDIFIEKHHKINSMTYKGKKIYFIGKVLTTFDATNGFPMSIMNEINNQFTKQDIIDIVNENISIIKKRINFHNEFYDDLNKPKDDILYIKTDKEYNDIKNYFESLIKKEPEIYCLWSNE